jgi:hypothetical protein
VNEDGIIGSMVDAYWVFCWSNICLDTPNSEDLADRVGSEMQNRGTNILEAADFIRQQVCVCEEEELILPHAGYPRTITSFIMVLHYIDRYPLLFL